MAASSTSHDEFALVYLETGSGLRVGFSPWGASIASIALPTPTGPMHVVLGHPDASAYRTDRYFMGATIGRFANRVGSGTFPFDGRQIHLATQSGGRHTLHGGPQGFHAQCWSLETPGPRGPLLCRHTSPDGHQGFPGNLDVNVIYQVRGEGTLIADVLASSDRDTVVSITHHRYFNLHGDGSSAAGHHLSVRSDEVLGVDAEGIPTGELHAVTETPLDYRVERLLTAQHDLDHTFVLRKTANALALAATLRSAVSGVTLEVHTTQPALQVYGGQHLSTPFAARGGVCLEPQAYTDAPNHPSFPTARLRAGHIYRQRTLYQFHTDSEGTLRP